MIIRPWFQVPKKPEIVADIFVAMPFLADLQPVFDDHIKPVAEGLGLTVSRADDVFGSRSIVSDIWSKMNGASLVIADCTGRNANVFYELGIAHTLGKDVLLITQDGKDMPFDVRYLRHIEYEFKPRGMKEFENRLHLTLQDLFKSVLLSR